jgi:Ca-activated chloride channel homolog
MIRARAGIALIVMAVAASGCSGEHSAARAGHNQGLSALAAGKFEEAEKKLLAARDQAGGDDELRRAAAYHLGLAYGKHAESLEEKEGERAVELYRQAASWMRDTIRLDPDDGEARQTLEVILRRIQALIDRLGREEGALEARLDRLVEEERGVLGSIRALVTEVAAAGASSDPVGFRAEFDRIATSQRQLTAEAGAIADVAADEQASLRARPQGQQSPEQAGRLAALEGVIGYLDRGRQAASEVRLALRRLQGPTAHARGDAALTHWKRAREQLLDPVAVLQRIAADHREVAAATGALVELEAGRLRLQGTPEGKAPPWLTGEVLAQSEKDAHERAGEVRARLDALSQAPAKGGQGANGGDPAAARVQEAARSALPHLDRALAALGAAQGALAAGTIAAARPHQTEAEDAILQAIERFAGLRQLIELAHAQQAALVGLLDPENAEAKKVDAAERGRLVTEGAARNLERVERLEGLLADEKQQAAAQAQAQAQAQGGGGAGGAPGGQADQEAAAREELFARAEKARAGAQAALARLVGMAKRGGGKGDAARASAAQALDHLEELRRLFFTLVERLKELRARQGETHDKTGTAAASDDETSRAKLVPPVADSQGEHTQVAEGLAEGLAGQADAAAQSSDPKAAEAAEAARKATDEVRAAHEQMAEASRTLTEAREALATQSTDLSPAVTAQAKAIDHLDEAIRLLEPPQDDQKNKQDQQKGDQGQDQKNEKDKDKDKDKGGQGQPQQSPEERVSAQQAERRLQSIRDREAERRRQRAAQPQGRPEPVDKDW